MMRPARISALEVNPNPRCSTLSAHVYVGVLAGLVNGMQARLRAFRAAVDITSPLVILVVGMNGRGIAPVVVEGAEAERVP